MKRLYCIRHGESTENVDGVYTAGKAPLTDEGKKQAKKLADRLKNESKFISFDKLLSSPFKRALETAEFVSNALGLGIEVVEFAYEHAYLDSSLEGLDKNHPKIKLVHQQIEETWSKDLKSCKLSAESFDALMRRIDRFKKYVEELNEKEIIFVGHSLFLKALFASVLLEEKFTPSIALKIRDNTSKSNTGITVYEIENKKWKLKRFNDDLHL